MEDPFGFPDTELYQPAYAAPPPSNPSKSILSLPTEILVDIARSNYRTAVALMCTNRVLHAAGVTALYARVFLTGTNFAIQDADAPNLVVPGRLGGLLAKREHTAALRYLKIISTPSRTDCWTAFMTLVYRVFERADGLVCLDIGTIPYFWGTPSPEKEPLQPTHPQNLHTLRLRCPMGYFAPHLLTAPSLKEAGFSEPCWRWDSLPERGYGPYLQVTSLNYIHGTVEPSTMIGDLLDMAVLFPSVERLEVKIRRPPKEFLDCVPQMGNSWAKVKQLYLQFVWDEEEQEGLPIDEKTKGLLIQAGNKLCPALDTGEVRHTRTRQIWPVALVSGRGKFTWTGGSAVASFSVEECGTRD